MPTPGATNTPDSAQDQIYSVLAQVNTAKLSQPLPVWYGCLKAYPEFAATPWAEFVGNDQWLSVLLSVSMGSMSYEALYVDDTVLWDPVNVDASSEVNGQQLPKGTGSTHFPDPTTAPVPPLGPFVANPPATLAQLIAIDFVFPARLVRLLHDVSSRRLIAAWRSRVNGREGVRRADLAPGVIVVRPHHVGEIRGGPNARGQRLVHSGN